MKGSTNHAGKALRTLVERHLNGTDDTATFCGAFERAYNLEVDRSALSGVEAKAFGRLFEQVVYYLPYAYERAAIPNYRSEAQIKDAAELAAVLLQAAKDRSPPIPDIRPD